MICNDRQLIIDDSQLVRKHIDIECAPSNDYDFLNKGIIVDDDSTLALIKTHLGYDALREQMKAVEITIDDSWTPLMEESPDNPDADAFWNKLVLKALDANNALLVINISNLKAFEHCWKLKQLVKQDHPLQTWPSPDDDFDCKRIRFNYRGYVLIVLRGFALHEARTYANNINGSEFDAMMHYVTYYKCS